MFFLLVGYPSVELLDLFDTSLQTPFLASLKLEITSTARLEKQIEIKPRIQDCKDQSI